MLRDMSQQNSHQTAANTSLKNTNESEDSKAITNGKTDNITLKTIHIRNSQIEGYMKNQCILCILVSIDRQRLFQFVYDPGIICLSNTPSLHLKWLPVTRNPINSIRKESQNERYIGNPCEKRLPVTRNPINSIRKEFKKEHYIENPCEKRLPVPRNPVNSIRKESQNKSYIGNRCKKRLPVTRNPINSIRKEFKKILLQNLCMYN